MTTCQNCRQSQSNGPVVWAALLLSILALLAVESSAAVAATGSPLILGKKNKAAGTSTLTSEGGAPLALRAPAGEAPLTVNSDERVARLNADQLDGLDSSELALKDELPAALSGWTLMVAGRSCPAGSRVVGLGGGYGAEDQAAANFGGYLYAVTTSTFDGEPRLQRDRAPLVMTACKID